MRINFLTIILAGALIIAALACTFFILNRPQLVPVDAAIPLDFPAAGFSHDTFEDLLREYVDSSGNVEFDGWHRSLPDRKRLDSYLAAVGAFSPEATPGRFPQRADELAYWMYGYNGYVIKSVLDHWPIKSVTDVRAPIEAVTGLGFFYRQRFYFGGLPYSLYAVENDKIRKSFQDPRIHFVLYCASGSCPVLRPELPTGDELERLLREATVTFISDPQNVRIDHDQARVTLSAIFELYRSDFTRELTKRGLTSDHGVLDYIASVAPAALQADLQMAAEYELIYTAYDWAIAASE